MIKPAAHIRRIRDEDLAPMMRLTELVPEAPRWSVFDFGRLLHPATDDTSLTRVAWIAEANSLPLGMTVVQCLRAPHTSVEEVECELESILVHPAARRSGTGQALLETAVRWCREQSASVLRLEVRVGNQPAIRLYERAGFSLTGRRPRYYSDPEEDALLMQLVL